MDTYELYIITLYAVLSVSIACAIFGLSVIGAIPHPGYLETIAGSLLLSASILLLIAFINGISL